MYYKTIVNQFLDEYFVLKNEVWRACDVNEFYFFLVALGLNLTLTLCNPNLNILGELQNSKFLIFFIVCDSHKFFFARRNLILPKNYKFVGLRRFIFDVYDVFLTYIMYFSDFDQ